MKTLFLLGNRLKQYFLKNKLLFLLFIIGGMLNAVMVIYCYGNLLPVMTERNSQELDRREYCLRFDDVSPDPETVKAFAGNPLIEACTYTAGEGIYTCDPDYPLTRMSGTLEFTGAYQVIVPPMTKSVGEKITIQGKTFEVIGSALDYYGGSYYIPYETFQELGYGERITRIYFFSAERQEPGSDQVLALIHKTFPENTYVGGGALTYARKDVRMTRFMLGVTVVNAFIAVLAYIFLLRYIVDSIMTENLVSIITGASKGRITAYIFWETLILSLAANGLGLLLHRALYEPVFTKLNITSDLYYRPGDYCFVYLLMLALSLIVTIPFVMKYLKLSPVAARREHEM